MSKTIITNNQKLNGKASEVSTNAKDEKTYKKKIEGSAADIAGARVRVYGKAQNRTALGIMHAYMIMYPQATMDDLKKAFPNTLNPDCGTKEIFKTLVEIKKQMSKSDWNGYFSDAECLLPVTKDKVAVVSMWTKASFEKLVVWAKQYGIVVADFETAGKVGQKGGFRLEYLNGYVPPKRKKGIPIWLLIILILLGLLVAWFLVWKPQPQSQVVEVEKVVVVHDTLYVHQIEEIAKDFNAVQFVQGKADLSDEAKFVLHDLAKVMQKNPKIKLRLEGHTSAEGDATLNQKLSEERAKSAIMFLIEHEGIDPDRLESAGFGSSKLKDSENPLAPENRRTEFIILN